MTDQPDYLKPGKIGRLVLKNRLVRAATSETMATDDGDATEELVRLYSDLARGGAGLIITGHIYVEPRGQYEPRQLELDKDSRIAPLARITEAVHRHGGVIFAELSHAGSQSLIPSRQTNVSALMTPRRSSMAICDGERVRWSSSVTATVQSSVPIPP